MKRTDIINALIQKIDAKNYLEIGVADAVNFHNVFCKYKIGVDPNIHSDATHKIESDLFFKSNSTTFDIIFIDGLHHAEQVYRDICNALLVLNDNGYIICHDMLPPSEEYQLVPPVQNLWTGDCWRAWVKLRQNNDSLTMHTIDTDFGCGIISKGSQELLDISNSEITWKNFEKNKVHWMNIISTKQFKNIYLI